MKKTLLSLIGSTAVLLCAYSANAADAVVADIPTPEVAGVQACDAFGSGFFFIPGTEACLKIGGKVEVSTGYNSANEDYFAGADASVSFETKQDSEWGTIGSKITLASKSNFDAYYLFGTPSRTTDITEAYVTVGPAYIGYKDSLFNTDVLYGDFNLNDRFNSTTVGVLQKGLANGFYAGLGLESYHRGTFLDENTSYDDNFFPDVVARAGIEQAWGVADLSGIYSDYNDSWYVKATGDIKATDVIDFRVTAGYGDIGNDGAFSGIGTGNSTNTWLVSGAGKYQFSDMFGVFAGAAYADAEHSADPFWAANGGIVVTPAVGLDVTGQITYSDLGTIGGVDADNWNSKLTVSRKF